MNDYRGAERIMYVTGRVLGYVWFVSSVVAFVAAMAWFASKVMR